MSAQEKAQDLRDLRRVAKEWPEIPCLKDDRVLFDSLSHGNVDFVADARFWTASSPGRRWGVIRPIAPWGKGHEGYSIWAPSITRLVEAVNGLVAEARDRGVEFIYLRCFSPEMPRPRHVYVDEDLDTWRRTVSALATPGEEMPDELYDC